MEGFQNLQNANITLTHKKNDLIDKSKYWKVRVLPLLPKIFGKVIYNQLSNYTESWINYYVDFISLVQLNILYLNYCTNGKTNLRLVGLLALFRWAFPGFITVKLMATIKIVLVVDLDIT